MDYLICPRCKKETDCLTGSAEGYYDKVTKKMWASSSDITCRDDTVCQKCYYEIRMQDKEYAKKHREFLDRHKDDVLISALHGVFKNKIN